MARARPVREVKAKSEMNWGLVVVAIILTTIGIWALAAGFIAQLQSVSPTSTATAMAVFPWYLIGVILLALGKWSKWKAMK